MRELVVAGAILVGIGCVSCGGSADKHGSPTPTTTPTTMPSTPATMPSTPTTMPATEPDAAATTTAPFACKPESTATWRPLGHLPYRTICSMARHPLHPERILGVNSLGWFSSVDEGETWCALDGELPQPSVSQPSLSDGLELAASPTYPQKLFTGSLTLEVQPDGSVTSRAADASAIQVDPFHPERLYGLKENGLAVSGDGEHFEPVLTTSPETPKALSELALDPSREGAIYGIDLLTGFWRSMDGGLTWSRTELPLLNANAATLTLVGKDPSVLYATTGDDKAARSTDGGASFEPVGVPGGDLFAPETTATWGGRCGLPLVDPKDAKRLLLPTRFGLIEVEQDKAVAQHPSRLLPDADVVLSKTTEDDLHFAAVANGNSAGGYLLLSADAGKSFDFVDLAGPIKSAVYDHDAAPSLFVELTSQSGPSGGARYSSDFGATFQPLDVQGLHTLEVDPLARSTLYAARAAGSSESATNACWFSRSQDLGASWSCIWPPTNDVRELCGGDYAPAYDRCSQVSFATDPRDPATLFVLSGGDIPARVGKSTDSGKTWQRVGPELGGTPGTLEDWLLNPTAPNRLVISGAPPGGGTWRSDDAGANWTHLVDGYVRLLASDPHQPDTLYGVPFSAEQAQGFSRSKDAGANWINIATGLAPCRNDYYPTIPGADSHTLFVESCAQWYQTSGVP